MKKEINAVRNLSNISIIANKIKYLEELVKKLDYDEQNLLTTIKVVGTEHRKDYKSGELMYDENGNPIMRDKYETVPVNEDELDDADYAQLVAIRYLKKELDEMVK